MELNAAGLSPEQLPPALRAARFPKPAAAPMPVGSLAERFAAQEVWLAPAAPAPTPVPHGFGGHLSDPEFKAELESAKSLGAAKSDARGLDDAGRARVMEIGDKLGGMTRQEVAGAVSEMMQKFAVSDPDRYTLCGVIFFTEAKKQIAALLSECPGYGEAARLGIVDGLAPQPAPRTSAPLRSGPSA